MYFVSTEDVGSESSITSTVTILQTYRCFSSIENIVVFLVNSAKCLCQIVMTRAIAKLK